MKKEIERKIEQTKKASIIEGSAASVMSGAGDSYIVPFALALNASNAQIGFLSSFVGLIGASTQLIGSRLVYKFKRKKIITLGVLAQASVWVMLILLGILYFTGILTKPVPILIALYCLSAISGSLSGPAWFSLLGDIVSEKERGKYFSKRNKIAGTVAMISTFGAAFILDYTKSIGLTVIGFISIFTFAAIGRYISGFMFTKHYDPETKIEKESYFSFWQFVKKSPSNNFGKFTIYIALTNIATNFSGPFFAVYMLKELGYSYFWFTAVVVAGGLFSILSMPLWGVIGDKYGNRTLLKIGSIIVIFPPIFWIFSGNPVYLILTAQLLSGFGWAAFNLAASNFIYDAVTPQRRAICVAYYTMFNGISVFIGALSGGLVAQYVHLNWIHTLLFIFLLSSIARAIISIIMIPKIKEVREIPKNQERITFNQFLYLLAPRPLYGTFRGARALIVFTTRKNRKENSKEE